MSASDCLTRMLLLLDMVFLGTAVTGVRGLLQAT